MRIAKPGARGGSHSIKQVTGSCLGGVWFYAKNVRGTVKRIYLSWSEVDQINAAVEDAKKEAEARKDRRRASRALDAAEAEGEALAVLYPDGITRDLRLDLRTP